MDFLPLILFALGLLLCLMLHASVLYALAFGYIVFFCYGRHCRLSVKELLALSWQGIRTIRMVLIVFCLIGLITATFAPCFPAADFFTECWPVCSYWHIVWHSCYHGRDLYVHWQCHGLQSYFAQRRDSQRYLLR